MSKSVDDAVCDYFSLLLNEPAAEALKSEPSQDVQLSETLEVDPSFSRQALELLFTRANQAENQQGAQTLSLTDIAVAREPQAVDEVNEPIAVHVDALAQQPELPAKTQTKTQTKIQTGTQAKIQTGTQAKIQTSTRNIEPQDKVTRLSSSTLDAAEIDLASQVSAVVTSEQSEQQILVSTQTLLEQLDEEFQVLFFTVAGLTLAVPLVSLGGIVNLEKVTRLMGRPDWYMGVQQYREIQLNVVDTCAWVMPEKYDEQLAQKVNYQYVVVLKDSGWGLGCESLVDTISIKKSDINWRSQAGKRPWLAGVVKQQMCGILNVDALVQMLGSGLGCKDALM